MRRAYGDWTNARLKGWKDKLHLYAIRPMQQFSYSAGKNATDMALERFAVRRNHLATRKSRYNKSLERRVQFLDRA
ncbi:NYN domain-containing protein [Sphingosinicella sp. BN140058]|uniref:NYN domain-containing protein n=1 Tax=Sphingosinicella sp. BN140058 TaxID=1892855 RepID=UPI0021105688|nr:NYN domain-containing protein [Sphingosinicella sp. BN140058]